MMSHPPQPMTVAVATVSDTSTMVTVGEGEKTSMVEISLPGQHTVQQKHDATNEDVTGTINSSRWTDPETMALLGLWRANYRIIKGKKRNYQEWNMIAKEFNRRVAHCSLGPRTGNQCKVRIKNLLAEYNRTKDQLPHSFPYHDILKEIINNKGAPYNEEDVVRINIPVELTDHVMTTPTVVTASPAVTIAIPSDTISPRQLRPIKPAPPTTPLNAPIASQVGQYPIPVQVYSEAIPQTTQVTPLNAETVPQSIPSEEDSSDEDDSYPDEVTMRGVKRPHSVPYEQVPRKKPRKNPRPGKVVQSRQEDLSMIVILREFLEDSRKREEDLFKRILQQQLEAESRYQQFTLDVLKEIAKMFKKD